MNTLYVIRVSETHIVTKDLILQLCSFALYLIRPSFNYPIRRDIRVYSTCYLNELLKVKGISLIGVFREVAGRRSDQRNTVQKQSRTCLQSFGIPSAVCSYKQKQKQRQEFLYINHVCRLCSISLINYNLLRMIM